MRGMNLCAAALLTAVGLWSAACSEPVAPLEEPTIASASRSLEASGARRFVSYGAGCFEELVDYEEAGDLVLVTFLNSNYEISRDPWVAGPAQTRITIALDAATGEPQTLSGSFHYSPEAVNGTWEGVVLPMSFKNGKLGHIETEGTGTGELARYGIRFHVNLHAGATFAPPRVVCDYSGPFLSAGEIFLLE